MAEKTIPKEGRHFEHNAGILVNNKGEMKGSAITGPVAKKCADLSLAIVIVAANISPTPAAALGNNTNIVSAVHHSAYKLSDMRNCPPAVSQRPMLQRLTKHCKSIF
uniref:Uncharacterized protein n=1 Tax=Glossina palpalis gambiensis TaxID=67801 RepID=A0A1B0C5P3_9MUSC